MTGKTHNEKTFGEQLIESAKEALALAEGRDELIPSDIAKRLLLTDESPVKVWREFRGMTQAELAAKAGTAQDTISAIENGKSAGRFDTMIKLARALNLEVTDLARPRD